jgi:pyruvate/2-oxoglutarate/acetoin dehydrogenase E1 component
MTAALRAEDPTLVIEHKALYGVKGSVPAGEYVVPFGMAAVRRAGTDVTLVSYSRSMQTVEAAAHALASDGIEAEVIDLRTIVPLDIETVLNSVARTGRAVVVHEAHRAFGAGAEVVAQMSEAAWDQLEAPVLRICGLDTPVPYADSLESKWLPRVDQVIEAATALVEGTWNKLEGVGRR